MLKEEEITGLVSFINKIKKVFILINSNFRQKLNKLSGSYQKMFLFKIAHFLFLDRTPETIPSNYEKK
jgi:hypothetical protein